MTEWESIVGSSKASSYGSCIRSTEPATKEYVKHFLEKSDTLQGVALKYNSSTEELRRINKLYSSDSIFVRHYLLVPAPATCSASAPVDDILQSESSSVAIQPEESKELDALSFLQQLDSKINAGKLALEDYKIKGDTLNISSPGFTPTAKYFPSTRCHKIEPGTVFSHSRTKNSDHLYQL